MATSSDYEEGFYRLAGQVIRRWAELEHSLSAWLIDLLAVDELRSRIIWDSFGDFRGKVNLLKSLTRNFADEDLWPVAMRIFDDVEAIAAKRYILPHAFGEIDKDETKLSFFSERPGPDYVVAWDKENTVDNNMLRNWMGVIEECLDSSEKFRKSLSGKVFDECLSTR